MALGGGAPHPPAVPAGAGHAGGSRGAIAPLPDRNVQRCVGWLTPLKSVSQPSAEPPKPPPGPPRNKRPPGRRWQAPRPLGRPPPGRLGGQATRHSSATAALSAARPDFRPSRTPRGPAIVALRRFYCPATARETLPRATRGGGGRTIAGKFPQLLGGPPH